MAQAILPPMQCHDVVRLATCIAANAFTRMFPCFWGRVGAGRQGGGRGAVSLLLGSAARRPTAHGTPSGPCHDRARPRVERGCQLDFARAYDSVRHEAAPRAMATRGVPKPVIAADLRDLRSSELAFRHGILNNTNHALGMRSETLECIRINSAYQKDLRRTAEKRGKTQQIARLQGRPGSM